MEANNYKPLWRLVLLKEQDKVEETKGGILIPKGIGPKVYKVIDVGENCSIIKKGDTVLIDESGFKSSLEFEEGLFFQINESLITGKIEM